MNSSAIIVALRVAATPERAFAIFTQEIGDWWRPDSFFPITPQGDGRLEFIPGEGGRLISHQPGGETWTIGDVTAWEPGERLAMSWRQANFPDGIETGVDIRFEPIGEETRITVEHGGWDAIAREHAARHGLSLMVVQKRGADYWLGQLQRLARCAARE